MRQAAVLPVQVEKIPDLEPTSKEWAEWCREREFTPLASARRAWHEATGYLGISTHLVYYEGTLLTAAHRDELKQHGVGIVR